MLAINGVPLTQCNQEEDIVKHVNAAIASIRASKRVWKLVFHESKIMAPVPGQPPRTTVTSAGILQKTTGKYPHRGLEHDITWYRTIVGVGDKKKFRPTNIDFSGTMPLDPKKEADKIFYLTCVSPACFPFDFLRKYTIIRDRADYFYKVEDSIQDAKISNVHSSRIAKVGSLIYDEDFGLERDEIRKLARLRGIANAIDDDMEFDVVQQRLNNYLLTQKDGKYNMSRIEAFLEDVKDSAIANLRKLVTVAIRDQLVVVSPNANKNPSWYDVDKEGKPRKHILTIPKNSNKEAALVAYFAKNKDARKNFEEYVRTGTGGVRPVKKEHVIETV